MSIDDRFDELLADLAGFYRAWLVYLGLETGTLAALRESAPGMTSEAMAGATGNDRRMVDGWARAAYAHRLLDIEDPADGGIPRRFLLDADLAAILMDEDLPEFLGGQFAFTVGASLDHGAMVDVFRTGKPHAERTANFHRSVERLNAQDIKLFFEQVLPKQPSVRSALEAGDPVLDVACGGAGWLLAIAEEYTAVRAVGVEFDPEWLVRARQRVSSAGVGDRIAIERRDPAALGFDGRFALVYLQDVLHELPDPVAALSSAWQAVAPGGALLVFDWCMPSSWDEYRTPHGELLWGYQLDELYQGTSLLTREEFHELFAEAGIGDPDRVELDAGATVFSLRREG